MASSSSKRIGKEISEIENGISNGTITYLRNLEINETDLHNFKITILPYKEPYNNGAFKLTISYPADYPFKPMQIKFVTPIYHPNVNDKGEICLPIIAPENWKPTTKTEQVLQSLVALVDGPEPDHPLRPEVADEFLKDRKKFNQNAAKHTQTHAESR